MRFAGRTKHNSLMKSIILALSLFCCLIANAQIVVDQHPVSNKNWSTFLTSIKNDPTLFKKYRQSMVPDQWGTEQTSLKQQNAPVVGVSWQQALAYCEWRSVVATYLHSHPKLDTYQTMQSANTAAKTLIVYRLPSEKEWEKLASRFTNSPNSGIGFRCVHSIRKTA